MIGQRYRVPPPHADELIAWPESFGTRFIVFVDVEEEFDWTKPLDAAHRSTTAMAAFGAAHRRFADRGVALACMIDHPIACDPAAGDILARVIEDGRSEIGTQLHPWVNPPIRRAETPADSYVGNLPAAEEAAKLDCLTDAITTRFGQRPRAFRAGRYGIGPRTLALLASRGYRIDSSVRARHDYSMDGGPDFNAVGNVAYRRDGILELPLGSVFTGVARRAGPAIHPALRRLGRAPGLLSRTGLLSRIPLTPEGTPIRAALRAVTAAIGDGERLLVFSFHSPSLVPGHTPYVRDAAGLARFHQWWATMLDALDRAGVRNASIGDVLAAADGGPTPPGDASRHSGGRYTP